jgi:hypothetical protein
MSPGKLYSVSASAASDIFVCVFLFFQEEMLKINFTAFYGYSAFYGFLRLFTAFYSFLEKSPGKKG